MFINCDRKLLFLLIFLVISIFSCRKKEHPLYLDTYEYELGLPRKYEISTAKWSPSGDKILILACIPDDIGSWYKSFHFFIADTTKKPSFEEVFSYPSENYSFLKFAFWSTDSTFIFEAGKTSKRDDHDIYIIYKFNTSTKETTRIYEEDNEFFLRDANDHNFLFIKTPENVFYHHNAGGVLSLYEKSLIDNLEPIRLTALHPDTLLALSSVNSARYITDNKVVIEKTIAKSLNNYRPWIRRLELLNLSNNTHQLLKEYICSLEDLDGIGFEVSPSGEWLIYSEPIIPRYFLEPDTLKLLSIIYPTFERSLILRRRDKKIFSYWAFAFWAFDWSPNGDKILCVGMRKKTRETKLYIIKFPKHIN
ncbi:hypothetical protein KAX75_03220 [candidate division WOR-3 bacterium]|nr:hypothetical protein [candidate division WOR-3 bacterium]